MKKHYRKYTTYICRCGDQFIRRSDYKYNTTNCTQCQRKLKNQKLTKHGHAKKINQKCKKSKTYCVWDAMKQRCLNEKHKHYYNYGGRGIKICNEWLESFESFLKDMGEKPSNHTLDRIDNQKGYYKENCRWATKKEQQNNRRTNKKFTFNEITKTAQEWCDFYNTNWNAVRGRILRGMDPETAFRKPIDDKIWKNRVK